MIGRVALLVLLVGLSGCLDAPEDSEGEMPSVGPGVEPDDLTFEVELEECTGATLYGNVPADWVRPFVPEGFEPISLAPGVYDVRFNMFDCARMVHNESVEEDVRIFDLGLSVAVRLENHSEDFSVLNLFSFVTSSSIHQELESLGAHPVLAEIARSEEPSAVGSERGWVASGDGCTFQFSFLDMAVGSTGRTEHGHSWHAGPPHVRMRLNATYDQARAVDQDAVELTMTGGCGAHRVFGETGSWFFHNIYRWNAEISFDYKGGYQ